MKPVKIKVPEAFGKVAVLMGGHAAEREISLKSGQAVYAALQRQGVDAIAIDVRGSVIDALAGQAIDRVFNIMHGRGGEDGVLQAVLEVMEIPYTGSGVLASALAMDKLRTKLCWQGRGLKTPAWRVLHDETEIPACIQALGFPVMVKPALEGSSLGMSKAVNEQELIAAYRYAAEFGCEVYAEQWVQGEEFTVAVLHDEALPAIRLQTPNSFYDYQAKYFADTTQYHCPCGLPEDVEHQLKSMAVTACEVLGISGWARVDMFIDQHAETQLIEANTVPGMTDHSLVPMAAKVFGINFDELVWRILESSCHG